MNTNNILDQERERGHNNLGKPTITIENLTWNCFRIFFGVLRIYEFRRKKKHGNFEENKFKRCDPLLSTVAHELMWLSS